MKWDERIGRRLTLRDLSILLATVEAGSMSKAAVELGVSQPAISKTIVAIERAVGAEVLRRSPRGVEPTELGGVLLARTRAAFQELKDGIDAIETLSDPQAGELRIAANEAALFGIVPAVINRLYRRSPDIVFNVVPAYSLADQIRELEQGNVELVIGRMAKPLFGNHIEARELFQEELVVVAGRAKRWARRKKIELAELIDESWIFPPLDSVSGKAMEQAFEASGLGLPRIAVIASSIQLHRRLIMGSDFLTMFSSSTVRSAPNVTVLPVTLHGERRSIGILTLKHRTLSPLAKLFMEYAYDVVREDQSIAQG